MMILFRNSFKIFVGIVIGVILSVGVVYAATTIAGSNVTYSNTKSGLSSTNVQGAIDELYEKADLGKLLRRAGNFVTAYTYSESGANQCIMGDEETCQKTTCYKTKTANSCPTGIIILYKVNNTSIVGFNVLADKGNTMIMQSQKSIVNNTEWGSNPNTSGPTTILPILEKATSSWSNVNNQTYSIGDSSSTLGYSGCSAYNSCAATTYPKLERSGIKARMITVQEVANYGGCTTTGDSCKKFMTANKTETYWTMSAFSSDSRYAWGVYSNDGVGSSGVNLVRGARAVVEVTK